MIGERTAEEIKITIEPLSPWNRKRAWKYAGAT